jgi:hypothetical protein
MPTYALDITTPTHTKAGKVAWRTVYKVRMMHGDHTSVMSLNQFCKSKEISIASMLQRIKRSPMMAMDGPFIEEFDKLWKPMVENKSTMRYSRHSGYHCPHCKHPLTTGDIVFAERRARRDASPPNSWLRAKSLADPAYFGEQPNMANPSPASGPE